MVGTSQCVPLNGIRVEAGGTFAPGKGQWASPLSGDWSPALPGSPPEWPVQQLGQRDSPSRWCFRHLINKKSSLTHSLLTTPQPDPKGTPDPDYEIIDTAKKWQS